jgi:hypothetical protein
LTVTLNDINSNICLVANGQEARQLDKNLFTVHFTYHALFAKLYPRKQDMKRDIVASGFYSILLSFWSRKPHNMDGGILESIYHN